MVNPVMVTMARESRGMSRAELAEAIGVSVALISRIEGGLRAVSSDILPRLVNVLEYPPEFFDRPDPVYGFGTSELFHRRRQDVTARTLSKIHALINIRRIELQSLLEDIDMGDDLQFRTMHPEEYPGGPAEVARTVRAHWRLPSGPVQNLTASIEQAGGIVIPFDFGTKSIDAISQWPPDMPPLFFVNVDSPGDRLRLTLAHEVGHILMHVDNPNPQMESHANEFAAEFLMPEREIRAQLQNPTVSKLATLKALWKVSMGALLKRAGDLGTITNRHYRTMWMRFSALGYRTHEPEETAIPREEPRLYDDIIRVYRDQFSYTISEMGTVVKLRDDEVRQVYFGETRRLRAV